MRETLRKFLRSWAAQDSPVNPMSDLLAWIEERKRSVPVSVKKCSFEEGGFWFYDEERGAIRNRTNSFFQISGIRETNILTGKTAEQPILLQMEIGYLGIICKEIDGILHCLMQAKIEPGNINAIQISPTLQATKSNFTRQHGGRVPTYFEYFANARSEQVVVDQLQSEQSSRFLEKRNRNIIILLDGDIEVYPEYKWMTIGQIKQLMKYDNLVNADTRTVLSCIPYASWSTAEPAWWQMRNAFRSEALFRSVLEPPSKDIHPQIYHYINDQKMFADLRRELVPLTSLQGWQFDPGTFQCREKAPFRVIYCDIEIEGREVRRWQQPLFEAIGSATFGLIQFVRDCKLYFIVRAKQEIGCFDLLELGPTVQREATDAAEGADRLEKLFWDTLQNRKDQVEYDVYLSEEGGRFYHEQNRNVVVTVDEAEVRQLPEGYFAVDYFTLNSLAQMNNCLNVQLRSLLSLLEA